MSTNKNRAFLDTVGLNTLWNKICSVFPNKTGQGASGTWNINVAGSASKITGAKIGVGGAVSSTATTFTGENDITIPITEVKESYLTWGGKSLSGSVGPLGASLSSEHSANRIAYLNPNAIMVEYTSDGGANWTNYELTDATKVNFVTTTGTINIGGPATETVTLNHQTRVTLTAQDGSGTAKVYTRPKKMLMNVCNNNYTINVKIETRTGAKKNDDTAWVNAGSYVVSGWSGWNDIPLVLGNFGGSASQTANIWQIRLTYYITKITTSTDYLTKKPYVLGIRLFGDTAWTPTSNLGNTGHLYSYDWQQNATFPANVTATKFVGPLEGKASTAAIADLASAVKAPASTSTTSQYIALTDGSNNLAYSAKMYANANTGLLAVGSLSTSSITASGNITLMASNQHNTDQFINFKYSTTDLDDYSWRIGYIGSGSANGNYFAIQSNGVGDKWDNVLHFGLTDHIAYFKNTPKVGTTNVSLEGHTHNYSLPDHTTPLFTGATSAADGKAGHVPAPLKADRSKFLKGDGTWAAIVAPDVDTSTSGGASQTTDKIFLVGAKTQAEYAQTFSNSEVYAQNGELYSKGTKVSLDGHTHPYSPLGHTHTKSEITDFAHTHNYAPHYSWTAKVKGVTWSRLCYVDVGASTVGSKFILNIAATRSNVVYNDTFIITSHHSQNGTITKISGSKYSSGYKIRIVSNGTGQCYVELYDNCHSVTNATEQNVYCRLTGLFIGDITTYTTFTDGTTVPTNFKSARELTTNSDDLQGSIKVPYTSLTGSSTTANQAIVSSGTADGWTLKTLGANAFSNTSYLPIGGGELTGNLTMKDGTTIKLSQYSNRSLTISGNSIVADLSNATGGWAGGFATLIDPVGDSTTMLGWYGGTEGLTHIYMGGAYNDPFMKMTKAGQFTFKYTPKVGSVNVSLEDHNHDSVYSKLSHTHDVFTTENNGFVPASGTNTSKFLRGDGTWVTPSNSVPSGLCSTGATTAAKAASFTYFTSTGSTDYPPTPNRYFQITFRYGNTKASAITLNVNSTGPKPLYINGNPSSSTNYAFPYGPYIVYYDGTNYYINTDGTIPRVSHVGHTHDDLATKTFVGEQISALVGDAPELLDTLGEIADALNDDHNLATNLLTAIDKKLDKITYEYNKELALGSDGKVCIGKFPMYDSNITVHINSTTSTTYHGTLVIATQNINTTGGGSYNATVYGDADNALTDRIRIKYISGSNNFEVYINLPGWSKNSLHIKAVALKAAPTNIAEKVEDIPADATIIPVNALYNNFVTETDYSTHVHDDRYYTETEADDRFAAKTHGTHVTGVAFTSGNKDNGSHDCNAIKSNGHWYYTSNGPAKSLGATTDDGALYSQAYSTAWVAQIAQDYRNGNLFTRGLSNGTWTAWKAVSYNGHTHTKSDITDFAHTHDATNITSGTLDIARIPTGTTATTVALGNHVHSASILTSGYLNTHPENNPIVIPFINNDLAFLGKKGGSYEVYKTTSTDFTAATLTKEEVTISSGDNMFDGSPAYATISTTGEYTAVIDMTLHKTFTYSNVFYIDFGAAQWRAKNVSVYVMNSAKESKYVLKQTVSSLATGNWYAGVSHSVTIDGTTTQGFNKLRVVLSGFQSPSSTSGKRIAQIGLLNYSSAGATETFISRGGCSGIYGHLVPHTTNAIDLGSSSKKWRYVYGTLKGTADEAVKLTTGAGTATKPVYFSDGKPVQCNASLDVNISGNATTATTATNISNKPVFGSSGNDINITVGGKTSDNFTVPYASTAPWSGITGKPSTFTPSEHNHDSLYIKKNGGGAITNGDLKIATNAGTTGFYVQRGGDTESTKFYQNDAGLNLEVVNDEANADINFYLSATDTERATDKGADAFEKKLIKFAATKANGTSITADKFIGNVTGNVSGSSGSCTGNAATASKLVTPRNIKLTGAVTGNADFDGSKAIEIATALNDAVYTESNRFAGWSAHGATNKYYCVAETTLGISGNVTLAYYVTRTHTGSTSKGIIQYHVRNDEDGNGSRKLTLHDWSMPFNIGLSTDAFKLTWKVSGNNVIVKLYVLATGWNSYELSVLTNSGWGSPLRNTKFYYGAYNATSNPGLDALPSNETLVTTNITVNSVSASDKWSTARTLTIGNTGKTVDGSKNVAWTLAEIGAMAAGDTSHGVHVTTGAQTWSGNKTFNNHIILGGQNSSSSASSTGQILFGASGAKMTSNGNGNIIMNPSSGTDGQIIFNPKSGDSYIKVAGTKVSLEGHNHNGSYYTESEIDSKLGNYVTLSGDQTITGKKTFNANVSVSSGKALTIGDCAITYNATTGCLEITC